MKAIWTTLLAAGLVAAWACGRAAGNAADWVPWFAKRSEATALAGNAAQSSPSPKSPLKTKNEMISYSVGVEVARNVRLQGVELDADALVRGLRDTMAGEPLLLSEDEVRATLSAYQSEARRNQVHGVRIAAEENRKEGAAFLAQNKLKDGVIVLPSGLQYKVLKAGDGATATEANTVECNYRGTLLDGAEFQSTYRGGRPANLVVASAIPAWKEALTLMPAGSKWQLFVPPELAYGERGVGHDIGPNATLIYELELLAVK